MKPSSVILSVIGGAIAGAAVGLLFAPEKGTDTRDQVAEYLKELKARGLSLKRSKIDELADEIADELDNR